MTNQPLGAEEKQEDLLDMSNGNTADPDLLDPETARTDTGAEVDPDLLDPENAQDDVNAEAARSN